MRDTSNGRVVAVVNFLASHPTEAFTLSEIATRLGLSQGSAHRVLTTLTEAGYLSRHPKHRTYSLGLALVMIGQAALARHHSIDVARREMARLAADLNVQCTATAVVDGEMLIVAREGVPQTRHALARVGERRPFMPPFGLAHVAWGSEAEIAAFLATAPAAKLSLLRRAAQLVRQRGYAIAANGPGQHALRDAILAAPGATREPAWRARVEAAAAALAEAEVQLTRLDDAGPEGVCYISAPVFAPGGSVALELSLGGLPPGLAPAELERLAGRLCAVAALVTSETHGRAPD